MARRLATLIALVGCLGSLIGCSTPNSAAPTLYSAAPITATVVDKQTRAPLAGVHVAAIWLAQGGWEGGTPLGTVMVMETETDESGRFHFPAWGPKEYHVPSGVNSNARVRNFAPELLLFKSGYDFGRSMNYYSDITDPKNMHSDWDGKIMPLERFSGTARQYVQALGSLSIHLEVAIGDCQWENLQKMIRAIGKQSEVLKAEGGLWAADNIYTHLIDNDNVFGTSRGCASPRAVLGGKAK